MPRHDFRPLRQVMDCDVRERPSLHPNRDPVIVHVYRLACGHEIVRDRNTKAQVKTARCTKCPLDLPR